MNNWEGNTLLYQSDGTDSQHRTFLPVPPPSDQHVNRALKVSHYVAESAVLLATSVCASARGCILREMVFVERICSLLPVTIARARLCCLRVFGRCVVY